MNFLIAGVLRLIALGAALHKTRSPRKRRRKDSPTLALVKKRHALRRQLHKIVGNEFAASQRVQAEALRLSVPQSSIEALEAAIRQALAEKHVVMSRI